MRTPEQLDLMRHSDARMARAYRLAAEAERNNPYFSPAERAKRAAQMRAKASKLESRMKK